MHRAAEGKSVGGFEARFGSDHGYGFVRLQTGLGRFAGLSRKAARHVESNDARAACALLVCEANPCVIGRKHGVARKAGAQNGINNYVGCGEQAQAYCRAVQADRTLGFCIDHYLAPRDCLPGISYLGTYDAIANVLDRQNPDEVVIALEANEYTYLQGIIASSEKNGVKVSLIPFYNKFMPSRPAIDEIGGVSLVNLRHIPLDNIGNAFLKRAMDIIGSLILIVCTSPLMLFAAVGVKLSSPGPILFKQERVGLNKKPFYMYKFRSMRVNDRQTTGWSTNSDPRKTKFGSFIRKFSIDELPQFFNVLKGDMSLVGPRPELPFFVNRFKESIPLYMVKHQVRPGITGWAQVNGFRGDTSIQGRIEHDIYYIENWTLLFDIKILFMTVFKFSNNETLGK